MKNVIKSTICCAYLSMSLSACAQEEPQPILIKEYETCCGAESVEMAIGDKDKLYVPNSFTPNKDGINDVFVPTYSNDIKLMQFMVIYSLNGDTLLYILRGGDVDNFGPGPFGWDGTRTGGPEPLYNGDFKIHKGGFRYEIAIYTPDGSLFVIKGTGCAIHCGAEAAVFEGNKSCFFPSQVNANGVFDPTKAHGENDCFK
jgi:hypothetical protein